MTPYTQISLDCSGPIARLNFERPESLNALSPTLLKEALDAARKVASSDARVLIVSGAGEKAFSAGLDLKVITAADYTPEVGRLLSDDARALARLFETMPQVTIARVQGYCFTGGLELALGCDLIVASENAAFLDTHAKLGIRPIWGLSQRLPRRIGGQRAREMSFTARRIGAGEAVEIGLALKAVPAGELDAAIDELAGTIAGNSRDAVAAYKHLYRAAENMPLDQGLDYEAIADLPLRDRESGIAASKPGGRAA